jgi:hypothetical protein
MKHLDATQLPLPTGHRILMKAEFEMATLRMRIAWTSAVIAGFVVSACQSPAGPAGAPLANGRWSGDGACLSAADSGCNLVVGCGHGQFPKPLIRSDGTFDVDGTYRIEVGPVSIDPAPPAHFSGTLTGATLILRVVPSVDALQPASYSMTSTTPGVCVVPCV